MMNPSFCVTILPSTMLLMSGYLGVVERERRRGREGVEKK
jgi:hypothetical protein